MLSAAASAEKALEGIENARSRLGPDRPARTAVNENESIVHQCLYWTIDWLALLKPLARHLSRVFLDQDRGVVIKQQEDLAYNPTLMLIDDADIQAKWSYRLKREWLKAAEEKRPFENPIKPKTLRWRS